MEIQVGFGNSIQYAEIPDNNLKGILIPNQNTCIQSETSVVYDALLHPFGAPLLRDMDLRGKNIAIITSDITRPMPTNRVLPLLLDELYSAGADAGNISLVFALGSHRKHTEEEKRHLAGERAYREIRCIDSDIHDYIHLGVTSFGTPVDITRSVAEADIRICLGNIEYHYFAGYSGGAKAIMPGTATVNAIQSNHRMMIHDGACAGQIINNPIRQDIEEAGAICGIDYILNVVLDEHKKIVCAVAGDATEAHRAGCRFLDALYKKNIRKKADIVIVSQGGAPKDINLYQTQKALDNAKHAVNEGGIIILVGSCREGFGQAIFQSWLLDAVSPQSLIDRIHRDFRLGGHKAAAIAMVSSKASIYLVSEMEPDLINRTFLKPYSNLEEAFQDALSVKGENASVLVIPYGGSTLPFSDKEC